MMSYAIFLSHITADEVHNAEKLFQQELRKEFVLPVQLQQKLPDMDELRTKFQAAATAEPNTNAPQQTVRIHYHPGVMNIG